LTGEPPYVDMLFWQFSDITKYIRVYGKMLDQYYNVLLFSNPGDKVLILVTSRGQIYPIVFNFLKTLSPLLKKSDTLKCWFNIFPSTLIYVVMLGKKFDTILIYGCSPI
jgi:hypothetical protein